jgi:hypothetical protein
MREGLAWESIGCGLSFQCIHDFEKLCPKKLVNLKRFYNFCSGYAWPLSNLCLRQK